MKSLEDLKKFREEALKKVEMRTQQKQYRVVVGMATCGITAGARLVLNRLMVEADKLNASCVITQMDCIGLCNHEPIIEVIDTQGNKTTYGHVDPDKAALILKRHVGLGEIVQDYVLKEDKE